MSDNVYVREYVAILDVASKKREELRLVEKKVMEARTKLYTYMTRMGIESLNGYQRERLRPPEKKRRKKEKEKREEIIDVLQAHGIEDPVKVYSEIKVAKMNVPQSEKNENKKPLKNGEVVYV